MQLAQHLPGTDAVFNYHLLRNALADCQLTPARLDPKQYQRVLSKAQRTHQLENLVLAAPEAEGLLIAPEQLDKAMAEIAGRYAGDHDFQQDLQSNGLDRDTLREALRRELAFDVVMQRVAAKAADINDIDIRLFFEMHSERFEKPELRTASHILITVNPDFIENTRPTALARIRQLADKLAGRSNRFRDTARRHSECPTAMEGGKLGEVRRGTLYPELDAALFSLEEGQLSGVVETEIGFHLVLCERIKPAKRTAFGKAAPQIRAILEGRRRRNCQKAFLASLQAGDANA